MLIESAIAAALRFRVLLVALAACLLVAGVVSLRQMPVDVTPELGSGPVLEVQTEALGLSSQEVEQYVTVPLENNLLDGVMGVWDVRSHSIPSLSVVDLHFQPGVSTLHARQLVEERLTNAFALPHVSKPPLLIQPLSSSSRVMMIGLSSRSIDPLELSYLARWVIKPRLSGVSGVANVAIYGQRDRQLQVMVEPARLAARHVTLSQVIQTAGNAQLVSPLSYLEGAAPGTGGFLDGPNQRLEVRPVLPLGAPHNLATVPIADAPGHPPLGSVGSVVLGNQPLVGDALTRRGAGLVLLVQKLPGASVTGVTRGVERALTDLRPALRGIQIDTSVFRPGTYVSDSLSNLRLATVIALVLALVALAAALLDARAVGVAAVAVAVSLLSAALLLDLLGYTLNALVVLGLLVGTAVVVDEALTATDTLMRPPPVAQGPPTAHALVLLRALAPQRSTLGYATLILLLCVAPAFFAHGVAATFAHPMLLAFALAVLTAMLVALTLTPALALVVLGVARRDAQRGAQADPPPSRRAHVLSAVSSSYERLLERSFSLPQGALLTVCLTGLIGIAALPFLGEPAAPSFRDRNLIVSLGGPAGASLPEMARIAARTQRALDAIPGVSNAGATLGRAVSGDRTAEPSSDDLYVTISPSADYDLTLAVVRATAASIPGVLARVFTYESQVSGGVFASVPREVTARVYGERLAALSDLARRVSTRMARVPGLGTPRVQTQTREPNVEVKINDIAALRAGVLPGDARRQASTLVSGLTVGNFFQDQAAFDVVVQGSPGVRRTVADVRDLLIDTSSGGHVRLGDIAQVSVRPDPVDIQHQALSRFVDVTAPVRSGSLDEARSRLRPLLARIRYPLNYHAEVVAGTPEDPTPHPAFLSYVLAAAIGIVLLLQAAFGSWRLAAIFFLTLPASLIGALVVVLLMGRFGSLAADAGMLGVIAFSVRQGMPLLAGMRRAQLHRGGQLDRELIAAAARERMPAALGAPLVLAAVLLPFALMGDVPGIELGHVAAATMLGGLVSATALNLLLLPSICALLGGHEQRSGDEALEELRTEHALTLSGGG